jgi:hypothetical protein
VRVRRHALSLCRVSLHIDQFNACVTSATGEKAEGCRAPKPKMLGDLAVALVTLAGYLISTAGERMRGDLEAARDVFGWLFALKKSSLAW